MEVTQAIFLILSLAALIEFCVDIAKGVLGEKVMSYIKAPVLSLAFGLLFAFAFQLDLFSMVGIQSMVPLVATLLTGFILSAGSKPLHEFIAKLRQSRKSDEQLLSLYRSHSVKTVETDLDSRSDGEIFQKQADKESTVMH